MRKMITGLPIFLLFACLSALVACGGEDNSTPESTPVVAPTSGATSSPVVTVFPSPTQTSIPSPTPTAKKPVVITIGNHTDVTGISASTLTSTTMALEDLARYYNENNLIPGIEFDVITYDGKFDPSRDEPGYDWLIENGADVIFTPVPSTAVSLKDRVDKDQIVLFTTALADEAFEPPGWIFATGNTLGRAHAYTGLSWIANYDPDFPQGRPAKLGGTFWTGTYSESVLEASIKYCDAHPDQYEFVGGYLVDPKFKWDEEVEALKDCDFVLPPAPMNQFVQQYRDAGYTGRFIGTDWHVSALNSISSADLWDTIDGMLLMQPTQWWTDEGEILEMTKTILHEYRPDEAESVIRSGGGYLKMQQMYIMFELIKSAVEMVGPDNFNSFTLYNTAKTFSINVDGCPHSYSATKRTSNDAAATYEVHASEKDIFRREVGPKWHPILYEP